MCIRCMYIHKSLINLNVCNSSRMKTKKRLVEVFILITLKSFF